MFCESARKMPATLKHRPAVWECFLGTVYAFDGERVEYFGYNYVAALEFAGLTKEVDPRWAKKIRRARYTTGSEGQEPRLGQWILWVLK